MLDLELLFAFVWSEVAPGKYHVEASRRVAVFGGALMSFALFEKLLCWLASTNSRHDR